ncbi:MAG: glycosyltransferase family 2 protein [Lentisphaeria bacterium]
MMRAAEFQAVGMFDPATFLYCEEQIIAERYATINKHALYCPTVTIDHYSGKTTERHITSTRFVRILQESFPPLFQGVPPRRRTEPGDFRSVVLGAPGAYPLDRPNPEMATTLAGTSSGQNEVMPKRGETNPSVKYMFLFNH